jgi:oligopeptide/dipeptide ABC transporter ATP-binding protein
MERKAVMIEPILVVHNLEKHFTLRRGLAFWHDPGSVKAVDGISFAVNRGETFSLVGESGCGKSTTGKVILKVLDPTAGEIQFKGEDVGPLCGEDLFSFRRSIQAVYQDPYASLNPRMRVDRIIGEPLTTSGFLTGTAKKEKVFELLEKVGLSTDHAHRFPHEFSGGQRQRIGIARALVLNPELIVLDEPVSALDVSIQAQILNLLADLQEEFGLAYLFISHDLSVVEHISDHVAVMYLGRIVERATTRRLFGSPAHPYTQALLSAVPIPDPDRSVETVPITGEIPSPLSPPAGCRFHTRCPSRTTICERESPPMKTLEEGHTVSCHLYK